MGTAARRLLKATMEAAGKSVKLQDSYDAGLVDDIFRHSIKKQTGVSLKYMLDFGQKPIEKQIILSAQFLHSELPIRLAHRVAELENLPFGLSSMKPVLKVRLQLLLLLSLLPGLCSCRCELHCARPCQGPPSAGYGGPCRCRSMPCLLQYVACDRRTNKVHKSAPILSILPCPRSDLPLHHGAAACSSITRCPFTSCQQS